MRMKFLLVSTLTAAMLLTSGCVYRIDIPQGNFVEQKQIAQLRAGMTREQVAFVLGSPMVQDAFDSAQWHYVYYLREGWKDPQSKVLTAHFDGDKLVSLSGDFPTPSTFSLPL